MSSGVRIEDGDAVFRMPLDDIHGLRVIAAHVLNGCASAARSEQTRALAKRLDVVCAKIQDMRGKA